MITLFVIGVGLLALGVAVARLIATVRGPFTHRGTRRSRPILLDGWDLPRK